SVSGPWLGWRLPAIAEEPAKPGGSAVLGHSGLADEMIQRPRAGDADERVDETTDERVLAKDRSHQIHAKQTTEAPVESSDRRKDPGSVIQGWIAVHHLPILLFLRLRTAPAPAPGRACMCKFGAGGESVVRPEARGGATELAGSSGLAEFVAKPQQRQLLP